MVDYLPVDEQYAPDLVLEKRVNADSSPLNTNGSSMIEFCKSTGFRILNGRIDKDNSSVFTYFSFNGNSTVDYALLKQNHFSLIKSLVIKEFSDLSDHCLLEIEIRVQLHCDNANKDIASQAENTNCSTSNIEKLRNNFNKRFY